MTADRDLLPLALGLALAVVVLAALVQRFSPSLSPVVELARQDWHCTSHRAAQEPVQAPGGAAWATVYRCDQWSRW